MLSVKIEQPANHTTEDGRWDYRVTIRFKNSTVATTANPDEERFIKQLWPDQERYQREEQRRFEILLGHWDLPVTDITPRRNSAYFTSAGSTAFFDPVAAYLMYATISANFSAPILFAAGGCFHTSLLPVDAISAGATSFFSGGFFERSNSTTALLVFLPRHRREASPPTSASPPARTASPWNAPPWQSPAGPAAPDQSDPGPPRCPSLSARDSSHILVGRRRRALRHAQSATERPPGPKTIQSRT